MRCNNKTDWDQLAHLVVMAYNVFPHTATGESPFFLINGWDAYIPTLHNFLQPNISYMGNDECKIHLDAMREVYTLVVLNLKMSHDRYAPPMGNSHNEELAKLPSYRIVKRIGDKFFDMQDPTGKAKEYLCDTYNSCIQQNTMWQLFPK